MRLSELFVEFRASTSKFAADMAAAQREIREFEKSVKPTTKLLDDLGGIATRAGAAMTIAFTAPIAAVAGMGIAFNAMQEQAQVAFTTMLGDGGRARAFLEDLKEFASKTPFEFPDLVRATQRLIAMGFEASQVKPTLTAVGNAVAAMGGGAAEIDRVTLALGQMQGRGKVATQEMNQLTEVGIPAWKALAEGFGVSEMKLRDMVEKGVVPAKEAIEILTDMMNTKFAGMMDKQSETFNGMISTIKDETRFLAGELTEGLFNALKGPAKTLVDLLHEVRMEIAGWSDAAKTAAAATAGFAAAAGPLLIVSGLIASSLSSLIRVSKELGVAWVALKAAVGGMSAGVIALSGAFAALAAGAIYFRNEIAMGLVAAFATTLTGIEKMLGGMQSLAQAFGADSLVFKIANAKAELEEFRMGLEDNIAAAMEQSMVLPQTAKQLEALAGKHEVAAAAAREHSIGTKQTAAELKKLEAEARKIPNALRDADMEFKAFLLRTKKDLPFQADAWGESWVRNQKVVADILADNARSIKEHVEDTARMTSNTMKLQTDRFKKAWDEADAIAEKSLKQIAKDYKDTFDDVKRVASQAFLDIFQDGEIKFGKLAGIIKGIFRTLATEILSTMTAQLITPLVTRITGALSGLLNKIPGLGGIFGGAAGAGTGTAAGAGAGAAGGGISGASLASFATNPITLAVAGAVAAGLVINKFVGQGRDRANEFVKEVQNPFGESLGQLVDAFNAQRAAGSLTLENAQEARVAISTLIGQFNRQAAEFSGRGSTEAKVVAQARETFRQYFGNDFSNIISGVDSAIRALENTPELIAAGMSGSAASVTQNNTYSPVFNITSQSIDWQKVIRDQVEPTLLADLKKNSRGILDELTKILRNAGPATASA